VILYLDTSSLVKLYVTELHSALVKKWVENAEIIATCRIAYPETISAFNKHFRMGDLAKHDYDLLLKSFSAEWPLYAAIDFDEIEAGHLCDKYGLRGFDAVHLSAAVLLRTSGKDHSLAFSSFDQKLNDAAAKEKMKVLSPK
jgi:uncharacterized protein